MVYNFHLLRAIKENGMTQKEFAEIVGSNSTTISRVINGWWRLDQKRKLKFAKALGQKPGQLFKE